MLSKPPDVINLHTGTQQPATPLLATWLDVLERKHFTRIPIYLPTLMLRCLIRGDTLHKTEESDSLVAPSIKSQSPEMYHLGAEDVRLKDPEFVHILEEE